VAQRAKPKSPARKVATFSLSFKHSVSDGCSQSWYVNTEKGRLSLAVQANGTTRLIMDVDHRNKGGSYLWGRRPGPRPPVTRYRRRKQFRWTGTTRRRGATWQITLQPEGSGCTMTDGLARRASFLGCPRRVPRLRLSCRQTRVKHLPYKLRHRAARHGNVPALHCTIRPDQKLTGGLSILGAPLALAAKPVLKRVIAIFNNSIEGELIRPRPPNRPK
jgi:hypothetical protein